MSSRSLGCPSEHELLAVATGRTSLAAQPALQGHIVMCSACRSALASLVRTDRRDGGTTRDGAVIGGRYVLVRSIGSGAGGVVWEARDERSGGGAVALKIMRSLSCDAAERSARRQRLEARVTSALRHPNIVPVLDVLEENDDRGIVLVMPVLRGETLDAVFRRERALSVERAVAIFVPVLDALAYAHALGVVHRDLKPQNVFLSEHGVRVLDFGLAKLLADASIAPSSLVTHTGELLGTPRYMAPEQIFGERDVDQRVDVWAAAALVYRAFHGEAPIAARSLGETMKALARGKVVPLRECAPHVPSAIADAVMRALVTDRAARVGSVIPLRDALAAHPPRI
ncbi:MAG TPA: serine/threonine-protein kinase [Labilithrix sp.]|nr:serine/threonine-protein kinase [Labilithrix sp.]